jgi:hypothetical protein
MVGHQWLLHYECFHWQSEKLKESGCLSLLCLQLSYESGTRCILEHFTGEKHKEIYELYNEQAIVLKKIFWKDPRWWLG